MSKQYYDTLLQYAHYTQKEVLLTQIDRCNTVSSYKGYASLDISKDLQSRLYILNPLSGVTSHVSVINMYNT